MKSKPRASAMNGAGPSSQAMKHAADRDRERDKRRRIADGNVGKEFQTVGFVYLMTVLNCLSLIRSQINFSSLDMSTLRKYARVHKIKISVDTNKEELVAAVSRHFANQTIREVDAITCFLYTARYRDSVLRLPLNI
ncbi:hypothetical protein VTP01DRAFT_3532 [Rhizomucor pusillus]|uniref:uncharacterized protein n=1 Tax=Rhizomucor pusillus TaxID=4840 RepID=UPI0037448F65